MSNQWLRQATLVVSSGGKGLDLSLLRFKFQIKTADKESPHAAYIRIYNVSDQTAATIPEEYKQITLQAGYQGGPNAVIFNGTIKQVRKGRETSIDSYIDIMASDGDLTLNDATVNLTLAAGSTYEQRLKTGAGPIPIDHMPDNTNGATLPRPRVFYGMARDELHWIAKDHAKTYSIQDGKIVFLDLTGYRPGEAVVINSATGMIGWPELTELGVKVRMLLNPALDIGCKLKINNASILDPAKPANYLQAESSFAQYFEGPDAFVSKQADGLYRIYVIEHIGDTRGNDWYSDVIALNVDQVESPAFDQQFYGVGQ